MQCPIQEDSPETNSKTQVLPILVAICLPWLWHSPAWQRISENPRRSRLPLPRFGDQITRRFKRLRSPDSTTANPVQPGGPFNGTLKKVEGNAYTVEDYEGNHVKLYVGQGTKHLKQKKVGDTVRAEITRGGFANSIQ